MRSFVVLAALTLSAAPNSLARAQAPAAAAATEAKAPKRDKGIPELFAGVTLTEEQKTKVRQLHADYHTQMTALKVTTKKKDNDGKTLPQTDKVKKQMADLEAKEHGEFRALLTPEQAATFDKNIAKEKEEAAKAAVAPKANP